MRVEQWIEWGANELSVAIERPRFEAELLMMEAMGCDRVGLVMAQKEHIEDMSHYRQMIALRSKMMPYEYIVKRASFYKSHFYVDEGVLIPRPETELLVEYALEIAKEYCIEHIAEIGVGSAAVSISLAKELPGAKFVATDISPDALRVAAKNIGTHGLEEQIRLIECSLLDGVEDRIDMLVSNPPYIPKSMPLEANVKEYEPHCALFGGERGDELLCEIILLAKEKKIAFVVCEMGYDQKGVMREFITSNAPEYEVRFYKDLAGLDRGFVMKRRGDE